MIKNRLCVPSWEWEIAKKYFQSSPFSEKLSRHHGMEHSFVQIDGKIFAMAEKDNLIDEGGFGRVKLVQDEYGYNYIVKIQEKSDDDISLESIILCHEGMFIGDMTRTYSGDKETHPKEKEYVLQPLISGETLFSLAEKPLDDASKYHLALHTARALQQMHHHNILHGDISPKNILSDPENNYATRLLDFGASAVLQPGQTHTSGSVCTEDFGSPSLTGFNKISRNSDIYSLGKTFYYLKLGEPELIVEMTARGSRPSLDDIIQRLEAKMLALGINIIPEVPLPADFLAAEQTLKAEIIRLYHEKVLTSGEAGKENLSRIFSESIRQLGKEVYFLHTLKNSLTVENTPQAIEAVAQTMVRMDAIRHSITQASEKTEVLIAKKAEEVDLQKKELARKRAAADAFVKHVEKAISEGTDTSGMLDAYVDNEKRIIASLAETFHQSSLLSLNAAEITASGEIIEPYKALHYTFSQVDHFKKSLDILISKLGNKHYIGGWNNLISAAHDQQEEAEHTVDYHFKKWQAQGSLIKKILQANAKAHKKALAEQEMKAIHEVQLSIEHQRVLQQAQHKELDILDKVSSPVIYSLRRRMVTAGNPQKQARCKKPVASSAPVMPSV